MIRNIIYQLFLKLVLIEFSLIGLKLTFTSKKITKLRKSDTIAHFRKPDINDFINDGKINFNNYFFENSNFNHIHIAMGFNDKYALLSSVTLASILYTANKNTYLHFHIITFNNFKIEIMEKINSLKYKINNNTEFIFYDGKQVEKDFPRGINEWRGYGDYSRFLITELIYDANRVIMLDSADILVQKDLLELYQYNIGDAYVAGVLGLNAGCRNCYKYHKNDKYVNTAVLIINNIDLWRKEKVYLKSVKVAKNEKDKLLCPYQDILSVIIPKEKTFILPLKYNVMQYFDNEKDKMLNTSIHITSFIKNQQYSKYKYSIEDILKAENDPCIRHPWNAKIHLSRDCYPKTKNQWKKYAKMTGFYDDICKVEKSSFSKNILFRYLIDPRKEFLNASYIFSKTLNYNISSVSLTEYNIVSKFIEGINSCKAVVTDSFHGSVFSILFNKPFIIFLNTICGDERLISLIDTFSLRNRIQKINEYKINDVIELLKTKPNISPEKIKNFRAKSYQFLKKNLNLNQ